MNIQPMDMLSLAPIRSENVFTSQANAWKLPKWVSGEHYENCTGRAALRTKLFKR